MQDKNINFVINGEIYLKRGPEIYDPNDEISKIDDEIKEIEFDMSKENPDFSRASQLEDYQSLKERMKSLEGQLDYRGTSSFWQVFTEDGQNFIVRECQIFDIIQKRYSSIRELHKYFIKLSDFFKESTFVGREFKRTKPIKLSDGRNDRNYMHDLKGSPQIIVLYATKDLFLAIQIEKSHIFGGDRYILINSGYTLDGNYKLFGPEYIGYRDKDKVYREILEQVSGYNKGKGKK